ncbi:MAG: FHA domain-containing protein [Deltaproteobacteria bacterium]|nr:FHA domain-containing protein [Deltaproteobacteria bacterium]
MNEASQESTAVKCLGDYKEACLNLDDVAFTKQYAGAFLVHHGPFGKLNAPFSGSSTVGTEGPGTLPDRPFNPQVDFLVLEVKRRSGSSTDEPVWLGRSQDNDIVIPDESVSAVHASINESGSGVFTLQDMNSMNGTIVDDEAVPALGMGESIPLRSAARIVIGTVALSFLYAKDFRILAKRLLG